MADNQKMILNLFAGMQDALFLGDRFSNGEFVSFLQPGQFISPNLKESDNSDDMYIQSAIVNQLIDSSYVNKYKDINYSTGTELIGSVDRVAGDILNHMALPYRKQSDEVLAEIKSLTDWLKQYTNDYNTYEGQYFDAVDAYETEAHKQVPDEGRLQRLLQRKKDGANNWEIFGNKSTYELKFGRLTYLTAEDPQTFWSKLRQTFDLSKKTAPRLGDYYQTILMPAVSQWENAGWASFERQISENDSYEYSKSTSWSGGIKAGWGLFSFGGGASGSTNYQYAKSDVTSVNLKFEYLRVKIVRPWLASDIFGYKFWTWNKQFGGQFVSDGGNLNITPPVRPIGRMPVLPQYLILVRNLELSAAFSEQEKSSYQTQLQTNASMGWGPFSISGSYSEATSTKQSKGTFDGVTFKVPQPQIIARTGLLLPKSPDPQAGLAWGDDAWIPTVNENINAGERSNDYDLSVQRENYITTMLESRKIRDMWLTKIV